MELMQASRQWATRPDDERFISLHEMGAALGDMRSRSRDVFVSSRKIECVPAHGDAVKGIEVFGPNGTGYRPTHWAFGQLARLVGAPSDYLRDLPAPIACDALNYGLQFKRDAKDTGVLIRKEHDGYGTLAAVTGPNYGRVWNSDVVDALAKRFGDGVSGDWRVPGAYGKPINVTRANTTLYGSDRDIFVFLCDENNRIDVPDRRDGKSGSMARGFFVWNSDVGSTSIGAAFFLFDYVCQNRIVWGAREYKEIRLRHTASAPDRWLSEVTPVLTEYANASAKPVLETIASAKAKKVDDVEKWLADRYTVKMAATYMAAHAREENRPIENLWDVATAMTAHARGIAHQDSRVKLEREAGKVLALAG